MKIGIIGAGLTGLTAARSLAKAGHQVTVCEASAEPGGLAGTFPYAGTRLETFYHHYFISDRETVNLIKELGLIDKMHWQETPMGVFKNNKLLKFATPMDLLKFAPLSFFNRIRFGVVALYLSKVKNWQKYENVLAKDWIRRAFGKQAWDVMWGPLLHGKFHDFAPEIGMPWFYSRIHTRAGSREKGMAKESLGYLKGSFQVLHDALVKEIKALGGVVRCKEPIKSIRITKDKITGWVTSKKTETFDVVLSTMAPPALLPTLPKHLEGAYWQKLRKVQYLGNVCAVLTVKRSLSPIYWMNIPDVDSPFIAVIEHTNFVSPQHYQGKHTLYLSSYLPTNHSLYVAKEKDLLKAFYKYLKKIIPSFTEKDIEAAKVFHAPYAQPVIRAGYSQNLVPTASPVQGLFVASMAQIYPEDRGMSYSIRLGQQVAETIKAYHGLSINRERGFGGEAPESDRGGQQNASAFASGGPDPEGNTVRLSPPVGAVPPKAQLLESKSVKKTKAVVKKTKTKKTTKKKSSGRK
jgi:protoporphyrinogen oxidase